MAITKDFKETVVERIKQDPQFAKALLDEALSVFLAGEPQVARLTLRDLVNGTIGFEELSAEIGIPAKSLHRMLSQRGNPTMDNLAAILTAVQRTMKVEVHTEAKDQTKKRRRVS